MKKFITVFFLFFLISLPIFANTLQMEYYSVSFGKSTLFVDIQTNDGSKRLIIKENIDHVETFHVFCANINNQITCIGQINRNLFYKTLETK